MARCCQILRAWRYSYRSSYSNLASPNRFDELRDDLMQVTYQPIGCDLKNGRVGVLVNRDDDPRILDTGQVLNRAGDSKRDVQLGRHDLAGLSNLIIVRRHPCVDCRASGADCAA